MSEIASLATLLDHGNNSAIRQRILEEAQNTRRNANLEGLPFYLQRVNVDTPLPVNEWPTEFRILHVFNGLMLPLPRNSKELDQCLAESREYVSMLESEPWKIQELIRLHEHFVAFSQRDEQFSLENVFVVDGSRMDELASTSPEPPFDVFINDSKIWQRPNYLRDEAILHEFTHRFRNKRGLSNTRYRAVEEGIVTLVSKAANSELHPHDDEVEFRNGYEFEATVMRSLLREYGVNVIMWMNEAAIEKYIGAPVSLLNQDMEATLTIFRSTRRLGQLIGKQWGNKLTDAFRKRWKLDTEINTAWIA